MNNKYEHVRFGRWSVTILTQLLQYKGLIFPPMFNFRDKWVGQIVCEVKSVVPLRDWRCHESEVDSVILKRTTEVIKAISTYYMDVVFDEGRVTPFAFNPMTGVDEIIFLYIAKLAKNGLLGPIEEVKLMLDKFHTGYDSIINRQNIEGLFL